MVCILKQVMEIHSLTHLCQPVRSTFAVRESASLGIMGAPEVQVPPLCRGAPIITKLSLLSLVYLVH